MISYLLQAVQQIPEHTHGSPENPFITFNFLANLLSVLGTLLMAYVALKFKTLESNIKASMAVQFNEIMEKLRSYQEEMQREIREYQEKFRIELKQYVPLTFCEFHKDEMDNALQVNREQNAVIQQQIGALQTQMASVTSVINRAMSDVVTQATRLFSGATSRKADNADSL